MPLGVAWGLAARAWLGGDVLVGAIGSIFTGLLKMLIVPLVLASIVTGMTSIGDVRDLGRIGKRTFVYYLTTTAFAVILGLFLVNGIRPGRGSGADELQLRLEISQKRHVLLLELARREEEGGRAESARSLYEMFLERYRGKLPEAGLAIKAEEGIRRIPPVPHERAKARRTEAEARWRAEVGSPASQTSVREFLWMQVQKVLMNPFEALAKGEVLAIIVFGLLLGGCLASLGEAGIPLVRAFEALNLAMMRMTDLVMKLAPLGVFALLAEVVASLGLEALSALAWYMATVVLGLGIHALLFLPFVLKLLSGMGPREFFTGARPALAIAFSTASSSATLPVSIESSEQNLDCDPKHAGFVLPLGATVNMDGTALYEAVAALFIAQVYGRDLGFGQQVVVAMTATLAAIGAAGIPSAGVVTMAMVLNAVQLPLEGIAMILSVDRILDMLRTTVNVMGDMVGAVIVDRMEKRSGGRG